jgi:hypothetical protein
MRGRAEGVPYDQKCIVSLGILRNAVQKFIDLNLAEISVGLDEWDLEEGCEVGVPCAHDRGVIFEIDLLAGADCFEGFEGDVFGVAEAEADYEEDHC